MLRNNGLSARAKLAVALVTLLAFLFALSQAGLNAQPAGDLTSKSQEAAQVTQEIDALDQQLEVATENYNKLQVNLDAITEKVSDTQMRLYAINRTLESRHALLDQRIISMYENGRTTLIEVLLNARNFGEFLDQADHLSRVTQYDANLVAKTRASRDSVESLKSQLYADMGVQRDIVEQAAVKKSEIEAQLTQRQSVLNGINQQIQQMLAQQQQVDFASEQVLNQQARNAFINTAGNLADDLAKAALQFLGVPYEWAASGPNAFDCSGLTMYVYREFGIDLPHNAALQYNLGTKISLQRALPGDLVFFGMPPHHVAMYLGNNMIVEAPQTGDVVKVSKLSSKSDFSGVCRYWK